MIQIAARSSGDQVLRVLVVKQMNGFSYAEPVAPQGGWASEEEEEDRDVEIGPWITPKWVRERERERPFLPLERPTAPF